MFSDNFEFLMKFCYLSLEEGSSEESGKDWSDLEAEAAEADKKATDVVGSSSSRGHTRDKDRHRSPRKHSNSKGSSGRGIKRPSHDSSRSRGKDSSSSKKRRT